MSSAWIFSLLVILILSAKVPFVRGFARELWCQREMREMIIPEIQSQIKSLKQIGVEYTFTLDFFPRTGKSLICSQRRISVETSQRMLSIQGYRGTLSA